jgi:EmrB/QacA subfamily drug resistance transporter
LSTQSTAPPSPARAARSGSAQVGARGRASHPDVTLAVIATGYLMVALDATVVNVALPRIQSSLHFSGTGLSWVLNAYTLTFGGLLLLGGRAGDILGRRRVLVAGVGLFTVASLLGGMATTAGWLLAARAVQGVGAAFITPSTLALIATNFAEGGQRNRALSIYSAVVGAGGSVGLIVGGTLTQVASWRWVLFINVPIGIALIALAPRYLQEPDRHPGRFDLAGAVTGTLGVTALVYGCIRASADGWGDHLTLGALAAAAGFIAVFGAIEARASQPIVPLRLFADRTRAATYLNMLLIPATMFGAFFFLTQFTQNVLGFRPLAAGLAFLPMALPMFVTVRTVPRLLPVLGPKPILVAGAGLIVAACGWLTQVSAGSSYAGSLLGPLLLLGVGVGLSIMPMNMVILSGVAPHEAGAASGLLQTMQWVGGSLGLAVLVTVFGAARDDARQGDAATSLVHGIATAFTASTVFATCALLVVLVAIRPSTARQPT